MGGYSELDIQRRNAADFGRRNGGDGDGYDLEAAAKLLGGEVEGRFIRCPSPGRPADDRSCYVLIDSSRRPFIYDAEGSFSAASAFVRESLGVWQEPRADHQANARRILGETVPATGTDVERYLRKRAITLPVPPCLRYHPSLWHSKSRCHWPVMVSERTNVKGHVVAIHRTYLRHDGTKKAPIEPQKMDCLVPGFDGAFLSHDSKDALWDKFYTAAPPRRRRSVEQYKIVKRA